MNRAILVTFVLFAVTSSGCTETGTAEEWRPPSIQDAVDPPVLAEFHAELMAGQPANCYLWPSGWPPEYQLDQSTPTLAGFDIPAEWSGLRYRIEFGNTGEEMDGYTWSFESFGPVLPGSAWVHGRYSPGSTMELGIPDEGPWRLWIWHCQGGRGEATFTVFDEVYTED